jgi:hypothetical protein
MMAVFALHHGSTLTKKSVEGSFTVMAELAAGNEPVRAASSNSSPSPLQSPKHQEWSSDEVTTKHLSLSPSLPSSKAQKPYGRSNQFKGHSGASGGPERLARTVAIDRYR